MKEEGTEMTTLFSKIKEVTELAAISGHEAPVRAYLREKLTPHVDGSGDRWLRWYFWYQTFRSCRCTARLGRFSTWMKLVLWSAK